MVGEEKLIKIKVCIERFVSTNELMMRTQTDDIFRKRTGQKYFFSLAVIDKKTYMKTNTRLLIVYIWIKRDPV